MTALRDSTYAAIQDAISDTDFKVANAMCDVADALATCPTPFERLELLRGTCASIDGFLLRCEAEPERIPPGFDTVAMQRARRLIGELWRAEVAKAWRAA